MLFDKHTSRVVWAVTLVILGFGHGAILNAQNFASQAMCGDGEEAAAAAMYGFLRHFGTALGVGIGGSTFQNVMSLKLSWNHLSKDIASTAEAFIPQLHAMEDTDPSKSAILDAYVYGFRGVFLVYLSMSAAAFLFSLFIRHANMNKELDTEQTLDANRISRIMGEKFTSLESVSSRSRSRESDGGTFTTA